MTLPDSNNPDETKVVALVQAFANGDIDRASDHLAHDFVAHVTNADGSTREVKGREAYLSIIRAMDPVSASLRIEVPQITTIKRGLVLAMLEIHAHRGGRKLHNFSGQLFEFDGNGKVIESWMVEALPAASDEFWS